MHNHPRTASVLMDRRRMLQLLGASAAAAAPAMTSALAAPPEVVTATKSPDSLPMQLYKSLNDQQREQICLSIDHPRRNFVSNWWYIHRDHRINNAFDADQQALIQTIFDGLHNPLYQEAIRKQVEVDQYGEEKNSPAVAFFGTPEHDDFEFLYTGHHVTRRCNAHTDAGTGFGGGPIFYGHFPDEFNETKDHPGNPYWYQGKIFNCFVQSLDADQQQEGLVSGDPRSERSNQVIKKRSSNWPGLCGCDLSKEQQDGLLQTMEGMLAMFRDDDVKATVDSIRRRNLVDQLYVSWYDGKYDIGGDRVWDTWQIESPDMVWYFRGQPHIHCYFHLKSDHPS